MKPSTPQGRAAEVLPVLAHIRWGAPAAAYWAVISTLAFFSALAAAVALFQALAPEAELGGYWSVRSTGRPGMAPVYTPPLPIAGLRLVFTAAALFVPLALYVRLQAWLLRQRGVSPQRARSQQQYVLYADGMLPRQAALICLTGPIFMLTAVGLGALLAAWPPAVVFLASSWSACMFDLAVATRIAREPGCTHVELRREGIALYGTGRRVKPRAAVEVWLTSFVVGAGWAALLCFAGTMFLGMVINTMLQRERGDYDYDFVIWRAYRRTTPNPAGGTGFSTGVTLIPERLPLVLLGGGALLGSLRVWRLRQQATDALHRRLEREAGEARQVQQLLLPPAPAPTAGCAVATLFQAAREVSGDFYTFLPAPPGVLRFALGDVAGKGMGAALTAVQASSFLQAEAEAAPDPAALLAQANRDLRTARVGRVMVVASVAELDPEARRLRWCNAGLPAPLLLRQGQVTALPGKGYPLGSLPQVTHEVHETALEPGDLLLWYTDGAIEAMSPLGDPFGRQRLEAALARLPGELPVGEVVARLQEELTHFVGDADPYDDVTAIAVRLS